MTTGHLDTTKYNAQVANAASQVKISSTVFKNFIGDVKDKNDSNYDLLYADSENAIGMKRQALINGNFDVWQRGTSFTNPASGTYTADRWKIVSSITGTAPTTIAHTKQSLTPGDIANSSNFYRVNVNGAGSGYGVNDVYEVQQIIENGTKYLCGSTKKLTISFFAKSDIANKKIGVRVIQGYGTGGSPSASEVINGSKFTLTTTWTRYSITFQTNTLVGKTFGTNGDDSLSFDIGYLWGSTRAVQFGDTVTETFGGAGNIDIAQVQVNAGDQALPFQPRSFAEELALCQRYYEKSYNYLNVAGSPTLLDNSLGAYAKANSTSRAFCTVAYKVIKRINPTVRIFNYSGTLGKVSTIDTTNAVGTTVTGVDRSNEKGLGAIQDSGAGFTVGTDYWFGWDADAEL